MARDAARAVRGGEKEERVHELESRSSSSESSSSRPKESIYEQRDQTKEDKRHQLSLS